MQFRFWLSVCYNENMKEYIIDANAANQRLDRYLGKLMPLADKNFLQKMLRKKRIKVNRNRAEGKLLLQKGDTVQIFFSEETITGFQKGFSQVTVPEEWLFLFQPPLYEDAHMLVLNKPAGLLCQPDASGETSLIDLALSYLATSVSETFRPGLANRLDRNTSGVIMIPKDHPTAQQVNKMIRERQVVKKYLTLVEGCISRAGSLKGYLEKDESINTVHIDPSVSSAAKPVHLDYRPIAFSETVSLLEITLHTGRTHQIRAQLADAGHPVLGDFKYGSRSVLNENYHLAFQLLHSRSYTLPDLNYQFTAPLPEKFNTIIHDLFGEVL